MNYSSIQQAGYLTKDPVLKELDSGAKVCNFTMGTNHKWKTDKGEGEEVCFIGVSVWAAQAEAAAKYLKKGSNVFVNGRLKQRSWETDDGQKRSVIEIAAQNVQFLDGVDKVENDEPSRERPQDDF